MRETMPLKTSAHTIKISDVNIKTIDATGFQINGDNWDI